MSDHLRWSPGLRCRPHALGLVALLLVALLGGCSDLPEPRVSELEAMPEANLVYPGATVLSRNPSDSRRARIAIPARGAYIAVSMETDDTEEQVIGYYRRELTGRGWVENGAGLPGPKPLKGPVGWRLGGRSFRLEFPFLPQRGANSRLLVETVLQ